MDNPLLIKALTASALIAACRIVVQDGDASALPAGADLAAIPFGVSEKGGAAEAGSRVDVVTHGFAPIEFGGNVSFGDPLTSDADGRAIVAAPAPGTEIAIVGYAVSSGDADTIGSLRLAPGFLANPAAA